MIRFKRLIRRMQFWKGPLNWKEKGEPHGRTTAKADPIATLGIVVTRANGTTEEYNVPATVERK